MAEPAVVFEERLRVPAGVHTLAAFRQWAFSDDFPRAGRIDFLTGDVEVEMSPEDLFTHGAVKSAISARLHAAVVDGDRGEVFIDRARVTHRDVGLSVEPDVVVVLWSSLDAGRVRYAQAARRQPGRFIEITGSPDLVVEVVSDGSEHKDTERLPHLYAEAGIPEMWLVDARGNELRFDVLVLGENGYRPVPPGDDAYRDSPCLGSQVRLVRQASSRSPWRYRLDIG